MANQKKDPSQSGMLSSEVTFRKVRGKAVISSRPAIPQPSEKQIGVQGRFRSAAQYARNQVSIAESNALYQTGVNETKLAAFNVAMCDYLIAPKVELIDILGYRGRVGDVIVVKATDDFMVTRVWVMIMNAAGDIIEEGDAGPDVSRVNLWQYKATIANPSWKGMTMKAIAYDRPANTGTLEVTL
jgi:hypothetical protein